MSMMLPAILLVINVLYSLSEASDQPTQIN